MRDKVNAWTAYRGIDQAPDGLRFRRNRQYEPAKMPALWFNLGCQQATPEAALAALEGLGALNFWPDEGTPYHRDTVLLPWQTTIADLGKVAVLWTPPDASNGESRMRHGPTPEIALLINRHLSEIARTGVCARADGLQLAIEWTTLDGFIWLSAAEAVRDRHRFKRCQRCKTWFRIQRSDALFCSASCRNFREETHG